jgi:glycosyltransferase involved in cell wall biosynthesis
MRSLSIVMLAPFGMRPKGTLAARMLPLAQALARRGHRVSIVAPPVLNPEDAGRRAVLDGVLVAHTRLPLLPGMAGAPELAGALLRAALAERPEVLHLFKPKGYGGLAALLARALRPDLPLVVDTDDWEGRGGWNDLLPYPYPAKLLFGWQERDLPRRAAAVTAASRTLETQVWGLGVRPDRVFYLPNGVSVERSTLHVERSSAQAGESTAITFNVPGGAGNAFGVQRSTFNLLLYTRFWEFDVRDLVAALVGIAAARSDVRLVVVGRGERGEERELLRLAARAGLAGMIDYRGWLEPAAIPAALAATDVALSPLDDTLINRARGLAKLLELMAAGLPIVASRVGQAAEYIEDGRSGLLVPPGDPGALARAVLALLADADTRARLSAGALARVAEYRWDTLARVAERAYQRALGE